MTILTPLLPKFKRWLGSKDVLQEDEFCQSILLNLDKNDEIRIDVVALKIDKEKLTNESNQLLTNKKSVESDIINYNKKLKPTDKSVEDIDHLKDNKKILSDTLSGIDNQLGEVDMRLEKASTLYNELNIKIKNHKEIGHGNNKRKRNDPSPRIHG